MRRPSTGRRSIATGLFIAAAGVALLTGVSSAAGAEPEAGAGAVDEAASEVSETESPGQSTDDAKLRQGSQVYSNTCSSCHQPDGTGLPGQFPPLVNNPNVADAEYVASTITDGLQGQIEVAGESYDSVMPSFSTLTDEEIEAVIAYIQGGLQLPQAAQDAFTDAGLESDSGFPGLTAFGIGLLVVAGVIGLVFAPRLVGVNDRLDVPWLDAWLKTGAIVMTVVLLIVVIPNWALNSSVVSKQSRFWQDAIGSGLFGLGLGIVIAGLWYAHRDSRI